MLCVDVVHHLLVSHGGVTVGTDANGAFYVSVLQDRQFSAQTAMCIYKYPRYSRGLQTQILTVLSDIILMKPTFTSSQHLVY